MNEVETSTAGTKIPHDAPAWQGALDSLTDEQLEQRIRSLGRHIGNLHTVRYYRHGSVAWRAATAEDLGNTELGRWTAARVAALTEQVERERRSD